MVLEIHLNQQEFRTSLLEKLDERLGIYTVFVLKFPLGKEELLIHYKEALAQEKMEDISKLSVVSVRKRIVRSNLKAIT